MVQLRGDLTKKMEDGAGKVRFRRWKNMTIGARISLVILIAIIVVAALADFIAPYSPYEIFTSFCAPDSAHLFGTDDKGRDVMSRLMCGAKYSLVIGLGATGFALVVGSIIGAIAAVVRPRIANVIMRILDIIMSFPGIALAATFIVVFGNSVPSLIFAIGFLYIPQIARIVRANVMSEYNQDYVRAVVVSGARAPWILAKHVVRNCIAPVMVFTIVLVADAIVFEASLSFISAGIPEPTPTWGNILSDARDGVLAGRWWQALFPGLAIMITVLCLNILSEGMTDALGIGDFVRQAVSLNEGLMRFVPLLIFCIAIFIAFSSGTSWGTFAILVPIVVNMFSETDPTMMIVAVSAVLAGAVCGDHISPISDTTIMSSSGAQSNHINHVQTQMQYAMVVVAACVPGYLIAGFTENWLITLVSSLAILTAALLYLRRRSLAEDARA